jgi:hypothetical protein
MPKKRRQSLMHAPHKGKKLVKSIDVGQDDERETVTQAKKTIQKMRTTKVSKIARIDQPGPFISQASFA